MARIIGTHLIATEAEITGSTPDLHRATAYATDTRNRWVASEDGSTWLMDTWEPMTDGDTVNPELVYVDADVIMVQVIP
jgi:hypothetical protein